MNLTLLKDFQSRFYDEFGLIPIICKDGRCKIQNKALYYFLTKNFSYYSKEWKMPKLGTRMTRSWLRAFFDCEAWVVIEKAKNRLIGLDSVNEHGIKQIKTALSKNGISSRIKKISNRNILRLFIYGKSNLAKFQRKINFLHSQKRNKLAEAINSYVDYVWKYPEKKKELESFVLKLFENKTNENRIRISSIHKQNLILLGKYLRKFFKINSKLYFCQKCYELDIQTKDSIQRLNKLLVNYKSGTT